MSCSPLTFLCPLSPALTNTPLGARSPVNSCQSFVMAEWLAYSEWNSFTLKCYLELSFAFKPFSFCGVASFFFFYWAPKTFQQHTGETWCGGWDLWSPCVYFLRSERKAQSTFYVSLGESKRNRRMDEWRDERKVGRMKWRKGRRKGKRKMILISIPELKISCLLSLYGWPWGYREWGNGFSW